MWYDVSFFNNPFNNQQYSRARKLLFAYNQIARLTALDATAFAARISATQAAADALSKAGSSTGVATGTQRGTTLGTDAQLQAYRKVVGGKYNVLLERFGGNKQAPLLITLFGNSVQTYTTELSKTNAKVRLEALNQLLTDHLAEVGADVADPIMDAAGTYLGTRAQQTTSKGRTSVAQLAEAAQETALNQALWLNLSAAIGHYPAPEQAPQRHATSDFSLLQRRTTDSGPHTVTGAVAAGMTKPVGEGLLPATTLRLHNTGTMPLVFALSAEPNQYAPGPLARPLQPGETLDLTAGELGDTTFLPYLVVANPANAGAPNGMYEVIEG
jgi:hypothetical protein